MSDGNTDYTFFCSRCGDEADARDWFDDGESLVPWKAKSKARKRGWSLRVNDFGDDCWECPHCF